MITYMMVQTRQSQRRLHNASQKVHASWSGPMPGSDKSASGTSSPCHHFRTVTASRVAGTGQHLTRPDSENMPEPPGQVERPRDQPEQRKRKQWSRNLNKEVMYCYYKARRDQHRRYRKRMHQLWQQRETLNALNNDYVTRESKLKIRHYSHQQS